MRPSIRETGNPGVSDHTRMQKPTRRGLSFHARVKSFLWSSLLPRYWVRWEKKKSARKRVAQRTATADYKQNISSLRTHDLRLVYRTRGRRRRFSLVPPWSWKGGIRTIRWSRWIRLRGNARGGHAIARESDSTASSGPSRRRYTPRFRFSTIVNV